MNASLKTVRVLGLLFIVLAPAACTTTTTTTTASVSGDVGVRYQSRDMSRVTLARR